MRPVLEDVYPKSAFALYGRGIDKLRQRQTAAGDADRVGTATETWASDVPSQIVSVPVPPPVVTIPEGSA